MVTADHVGDERGKQEAEEEEATLEESVPCKYNFFNLFNTYFCYCHVHVFNTLCTLCISILS